MFERGLTDGLPVIPPTPRARQAHAHRHASRSARSDRERCRPNMGPATIEKIAANAVMAGCKPEYLPVVIAAIEAVATPEFNAHGIMSTTWGATPVIVVNGPIRERIGMNMGMMALGYGNRANATIGRAVKLTLRNVGGAKPGDIERSTLGANRQIHHLLRRVRGAQPVGATARRARLQEGRKRGDGVRAGGEFAPDRRPDLAHRARAVRKPRALASRRAGIRSSTAPAKSCLLYAPSMPTLSRATNGPRRRCARASRKSPRVRCAS